MTEHFQHKKSLGQNFLNSDYVPTRMCDAAGLSSESAPPPPLDSLTPGVPQPNPPTPSRSSLSGGGGATDNSCNKTVLEIGPGTGALTREILARGCTVIALEADPRAISSLQKTFATEIDSGQLTLHHHDARTLDPAAFGLIDHSYKVVANIPYYLSGGLFRSLLDTKCQPTDLVFLVQKEVAERIARDKKESLLSLSVKAFGTPHYITTVKRTHFSPPPRVDSAIIAITGIDRSAFTTVSSEEFFVHLRLGFGQKRKQLLGNLAAQYERAEITQAFTQVGIPLTARAEDVQLAEWLRLVAVLSPSTA